MCLPEDAVLPNTNTGIVVRRFIIYKGTWIVVGEVADLSLDLTGTFPKLATGDGY